MERNQVQHERQLQIHDSVAWQEGNWHVRNPVAGSVADLEGRVQNLEHQLQHGGEKPRGGGAKK